MDTFAAFSTAPSSAASAMLPGGHTSTSALDTGFSTASVGYDTRLGGALGSPRAVSMLSSPGGGFSSSAGLAGTGAGLLSGRGMGMGDGGGSVMGGAGAAAVPGQAQAGGAGVSLFSTVPSAQPQSGLYPPAMLGRPWEPKDALLFSTATTTGVPATANLGFQDVLSHARSHPSSAAAEQRLQQQQQQQPPLTYHLRATRAVNVAETATLLADLRRTLEQIHSVEGSPAAGNITATNRSSGAASAAAVAMTPAPVETTTMYWYNLIDVARPAESASQLQEALTRISQDAAASGASSMLPEYTEATLKAMAACLTTPAHLSLIPHLGEPHGHIVRDYVLQTVLEAFEQGQQTAGPALPLCARMLAEMVRLDLVRLKGVAAAIAHFLSQPNSCRAGIAAFGCVAEQSMTSDAFSHEIRQLHTTEQQLAELYKAPEFEYDVLAINRLLSVSAMSQNRTSGTSKANGEDKDDESAVDDQVGIVLKEMAHLARHDSAAPPSCIQYVSQYDELFTAHADGVVALWGPPRDSQAAASSGSSTSASATAGAAEAIDPVVRTMLEMPGQSIAVAMASPQRGHFLVAAGMPAAVFGPAHPYTPHWQAWHRTNGANGTDSASAQTRGADGGQVCPLLRLLVRNESTGEWRQGGAIARPSVSAITAVAAVSQQSCVCSAESAHDVTASGIWKHSISFISAPTGQVVRTVEAAHTDYITALATRGDMESVLVSASRSDTVKLWDARASGGTPAAVTGTGVVSGECGAMLDSMSSGHADTITALHTVQNLIATSSLDGSFVIWDARRLSEPLRRKQFTSPVLDLAAMGGGKWAVATARGLFLLSDGVKSMDVIPNVAFTQVSANNTGELLFAAGADGVTIFSVKK